jgi:hypothetical protein
MNNDIHIHYVTACEYHRNGIGGVGFHIVDFVWSDKDFPATEARAIVFDNGDEDPTHYAITTEDPEQKWRGDAFIDYLWPLIQELVEEKWQATLARLKIEEMVNKQDIAHEAATNSK